jgi:hypothetical protein
MSSPSGYLFINRVGARFAVREKCSDMRSAMLRSASVAALYV